MTLTEWRVQMYSVLKRSSDTFSTSMVDFCINSGIRLLACMVTFPEMKTESTVATTTAATLWDFPAGLKEIYAASIIDGTQSYPLTYITLPRRNEEFQHRTLIDKGTPRKFTDRGSQFELLPPTDGNRTVYFDCAIYPPALTVVTVSPTLLLRDDYITAAAAMIGFTLLRQPEEQLSWKTVLGLLLKPYTDVTRNQATKPIFASNMSGGDGKSLMNHSWTIDGVTVL